MMMMMMHLQKVVIVSLANTKNQGGDAIGCLATHYSLRLAVRPTIPLHHQSYSPTHFSLERLNCCGASLIWLLLSELYFCMFHRQTYMVVLI